MASSPSLVNADTTTIEEKASLLILSTEIRFMIYDYVVVGKGTVSVFSQHDVASEVDTTTVNLLHVNKLIRSEVQEFFYKSQTFEFRSAPALNKFVEKIGYYHASIIKNIKLGDWLCRKKLPNFTIDITPALQHSLRGVEKLTISDPSRGYACQDSLDELTLERNRSHFLEYFRGSSTPGLGLKTYAILCASEKLACGKVYLKTGWDAKTYLLFVPKHVDFPPKFEELNPHWVRFDEEYLQTPSAWPHGWPLPYNPYEKTNCSKFQELAIPSVDVMEATLACALAPAEEHDCTSSDIVSRIETNSFDNPIVLSDKEDNDHEEDVQKQDEERVIADSDETDTDQ